jgi:DNA topoisomerase VI subunit B
MTTLSEPSTFPTETESPLSLLFVDLEGELATTRRMLERIPDGNDEWRPHEKSRSLGDLATHVAQLPGFGILMLIQDEYDGAARSFGAQQLRTVCR